MEVMSFDNGNTAVFDSQGKQMPELQESYILLFADFLKLKGFDPLEISFIMPSGKTATLFETPNGYNWRFKKGRL